MKMRTMAMGMLALALAGAEVAVAQAGPRARAAGVARRAPMLDVEMGRALDRRYELGLTDEQFEGLSELHREAREELAPARTRLREIGRALRDGTMARTDARAEMTGLRETVREAQEGFRSRLGEILDDDQRLRLRAGPRSGLDRGPRVPGVERMRRAPDRMRPRGGIRGGRGLLPGRRLPARRGPGG